MTRPEYIKCVQRQRVDFNATWCGRSTAKEWMFQDIEHAAENGAKEGRLTTCPQCVAAIHAALEHRPNAQWAGDL